MLKYLQVLNWNAKKIFEITLTNFCINPISCDFSLDRKTLKKEKK